MHKDQKLLLLEGQGKEKRYCKLISCLFTLMSQKGLNPLLSSEFSLGSASPFELMMTLK